MNDCVLPEYFFQAAFFMTVIEQNNDFCRRLTTMKWYQSLGEKRLKIARFDTMNNVCLLNLNGFKRF